MSTDADKQPKCHIHPPKPFFRRMRYPQVRSSERVLARIIVYINVIPVRVLLRLSHCKQGLMRPLTSTTSSYVPSPCGSQCILILSEKRIHVQSGLPTNSSRETSSHFRVGLPISDPPYAQSRGTPAALILSPTAVDSGPPPKS